MKKILTISVIVILAIIMMVSIAESQSTTDYKVIKNAVKKNGSTWKDSKDLILHITIQNPNDKSSIKIEIPFNIVEFLIESCEDSDIHLFDSKEEFKLDEAISKLRAAGPMTLVEINYPEENSTIKIWLE